MGSFEISSETRCFGGRQQILKHRSEVLGCPMNLAVFLPSAAEKAPCPVLWYLSGLTCTEQNVTGKSGFQRYAEQQGLIVICPDTSPRGLGIPGEDDTWDFGTGAGFYLDATQPPWSAGYRMYSYVTEELVQLATELPIRTDAMGITGHSMGGHGALVLGLKNPKLYTSISAFAPIVHPSAVPWGQTAFARYLGAQSSTWAQYDAVELVAAGARSGEILVDQGLADDFLERELKPEVLEAACLKANQPLRLRRHQGYDHSYYFISTFIGDHIAFHAARLKGPRIDTMGNARPPSSTGRFLKEREEAQAEESVAQGAAVPP